MSGQLVPRKEDKMHGKLKAGARVIGVQPEAVFGMMITMSIFHAHGVPFVVTSCTDSHHGRSSKHFTGNGWDVRSRTIPDNVSDGLWKALTKALGVDYDVVRESDHWHIEFDPKTGLNL